MFLNIKIKAATYHRLKMYINSLPNIMKSISNLKTEIQEICTAFTIGDPISHRTEKHSVKGYSVAIFTTNKGEYKYIFLNQ